MTERVLGIIGGSGLYAVDGLQDAQWHTLSTPWGDPSDNLLTGTLNDIRLVFLPRHGRNHQHAPHQVNYRANIDALKQMGVTDIISISACGSFREEYAPGDFVLVDQFIDRTVGRTSTFFEDGCVAHVSIAHPVCDTLGQTILSAASETPITFHRGGTYLAMQGPQFSTIAESKLYRDVWKCDVIGMTAMPEVKLAREAEICYATVAMVTDYDSWHPDHGAVDITSILHVMGENTKKARLLLNALTKHIHATKDACPQHCDRALEYAIVTAPAARDPERMKKLSTIAGRILETSK
jgi:5'-methylthioadenosine phosphorylase